MHGFITILICLYDFINQAKPIGVHRGNGRLSNEQPRAQGQGKMPQMEQYGQRFIEQEFFRCHNVFSLEPEILFPLRFAQDTQAELAA